MIKAYYSLVIGIFFINNHFAFAAESGRTLVNGFGISAPSVTTILFGENPAGLYNLGGIKLQALAGTNNSSDNRKYYNGALYAGNNIFGLGIGAEKQTSDTNDKPDSDTYWGLGGGFESIAIGVGGVTTGGANSKTSSAFGVMFGGRSPLTLGAIFNSDNAATYDYGAGFAYDISPGVNFALDAYHYRVSGETSFAAGVRLANANAELSLGYKVIDKNANDEDHLMAGLAFNISQSLSLQYLYNHTWIYNSLKHRLGLTVRF